MIYSVDGKKYDVIGQVRSGNGRKVSLLDIPMMSDERWQELAAEHAVENYIRENGHEPESVEVAFAWQREWVSNWIPV